MTGQTLVGVIQKRLDDVEGADATTQSIVPELRAAHTDLASEPMAKLVFFPDTSDDMVLEEGTEAYDLPADYNYNVERAVYDPTGRNVPLVRVSAAELADYQENYSGTLQYYAIRGNKLLFAGIPGEVDDGKVVRVWYSSIPDDSLIGNNIYESVLMKKYPMLLADEVCVSFLLMDPDLGTLADRYIARAAEKRERFRQELETQAAVGGFNFESEPIEPIDF